MGAFSADGREYVIRNAATPRPWVNIIANPRFGLSVSQNGSGFTWVDNSQLAAITRWQQEFAQDSSGKFLYLRDAETGEVWSLAPAPVFARYTKYACRHGLGYTVFETEYGGIGAEWTIFAHAEQTVELWSVELRNVGDKPRKLELTAYLEWCCGVSPSPRREFHRLFLETEFDAKHRAIYAWNHMWDVPSKGRGHWNVSFPYVSVLASTEPILSAQGDKASFVGVNGDFRQPAALGQDTWRVRFGRHEDAIAATRSAVELSPGQTRRIGYALAAGSDRTEADKLIETNIRAEAMDRALAEVKRAWRERLAEHRVETPDATVNYLTNDWVRYQAISGRLWGRCGYYQQSGAYGFRDQLQDSQVWLTIEPRRCREQIQLHARHQFADGSVYHWWHPLTEQGHITKMTDDLLWLSYVTASYIRETADFGVLNDEAAFIDDERPAPLIEHIWRAFQKSFSRTSARGLPLIGAGDWNDGLNALGLGERGESVWLGHFLAGLLADWADIFRRIGPGSATHGVPPISWARIGQAGEMAEELTNRRARLIHAINEHGWDGSWYVRATLDDGTKLGSASNRVGRIFLNAQTWAILNDVAPPDRAARCWEAVREHLVSEAGALLLSPAFDKPDEKIGYITRYAPGMRENGGVYSHAATWAIAAAAKMHDEEMVGKLMTAMNPANKDPGRYWAEPYVLPGNVDGPDSPYHGRAGWTWYTGSAQWFHRVVTHWVLGVRPEWNGMHVRPCLPADWSGATMKRPWRGCTYEFRFERAAAQSRGTTEVAVDGQELPAPLIPAPQRAGARHEVSVRIR